MKRLPEDMYDLLWMARRYADGRSTFSPSTVNKIIDNYLRQDFEINRDEALLDPEKLYASDGMFGFWRNGKFAKETP